MVLKSCVRKMVFVFLQLQNVYVNCLNEGYVSILCHHYDEQGCLLFGELH